MTDIVNAIKGAMRMSIASDIIDSDIYNCVQACKVDLTLAGVKKLDDSDPLVLAAVTAYVKADFNYNNLGERYKLTYDTLKTRLALAGKYNKEVEDDNRDNANKQN